MPKNKTRKIVVKKFNLTKTGKIKRKHAGVSHRMRIDTADTANRKKKDQTVKGGFIKKVKLMLGK